MPGKLSAKGRKAIASAQRARWKKAKAAKRLDGVIATAKKQRQSPTPRLHVRVISHQDGVAVDRFSAKTLAEAFIAILNGYQGIPIDEVVIGRA